MARRKQEWVIRVIQFTDDMGKRSQDMPGLWIENLRYLGLIKVHEDGKQVKSPFEVGEYLFKYVFDIYAPADTPDTKYWADRMAARMESFGINAVAAPLWVSHAQGPETPDAPPKGLRF